MIGAEISDKDFERLRRFFESASGIHLADCKKVLVCGRLSRRLRHFKLDSYREYMDLIESPNQRAERQMAIDLLTTNETHFFREPKHFERFRRVLKELADRPGSPAIRVWSAACSTGEEPYSLAMTMSEVLGGRSWSVLASDLSMKVLEDARLGIYQSQRFCEIPRDLAEKYVLEGFDEYAGQYRMDASLRQRVHFEQINLMEPLPRVGPFDVIFLRNVLIYFDKASKRRIVDALVQKLRQGGLLFIGHSETLGGVTDSVVAIEPTVYQRQS
ncbi:protein-glutamate O-methyltransferase CheR [Aquabacterium sp.]|uniref:CheR family methyltransferase n=1 Tax=Aquabacterium sp. TaxID=1872578 RepID=UPI0025C5BF39|nr:protein-glutamate O-methyltransferase CheR [Aquabacterium sp.]